jgi:hypothetical protein
MTKQELEARIEEIIDENKAYIADIKNGWDIGAARAENIVLEKVLGWVKELK